MPKTSALLVAGLLFSGLLTMPAITQTTNDAELRARAEKLHRAAIVIDTHNDITSAMRDEAFDLGARDTYQAIIVSHLTFVVPVVTWFLIGFFDGVPREFEEQAMVDGYSRLQAFRRVVLPQVLPGIGAAGIFAFVLSWNDLFYALILAGGNTTTLPVKVASFNTFRGVELGAMSAAILVSVVPVVIACFFVQRRLVRGISGGGLKS